MSHFDNRRLFKSTQLPMRTKPHFRPINALQISRGDTLLLHARYQGYSTAEVVSIATDGKEVTLVGRFYSGEKFTCLLPIKSKLWKKVGLSQRQGKER